MLGLGLGLPLFSLLLQEGGKRGREGEVAAKERNSRARCSLKNGSPPLWPVHLCSLSLSLSFHCRACDCVRARSRAGTHARTERAGPEHGLSRARTSRPSLPRRATATFRFHRLTGSRRRANAPLPPAAVPGWLFVEETETDPASSASERAGKKGERGENQEGCACGITAAAS